MMARGAAVGEDEAVVRSAPDGERPTARDERPGRAVGPNLAQDRPRRFDRRDDEDCGVLHRRWLGIVALLHLRGVGRVGRADSLVRIRRLVTTPIGCRDDADIRGLDGRIGDQRDGRAIGEGEAVTTGEGKGGIGQVGREVGMNSAKRLQVGRGEVNRVTVRDECSLAIAVSRRLHRSLEPALELDRLEPGPEQASGLALEDAFEEPLQGGHWGAHGPSQSSRRPGWAPAGPARGGPAAHRRKPRSCRAGARPQWMRSEDHRPGSPVPADEAAGVPCDILSPRSGCRSVPACSSRTRGHDARDPHRIILRALRHSLHV
jgi:hypothetical protein